MNVKIQVTKETKDRLDTFRNVLGTKDYDDTVKELTKANSFKLIEDLEGILEGAPRFERDKHDRDFTGHVHPHRLIRKARNG